MSVIKGPLLLKRHEYIHTIMNVMRLYSQLIKASALLNIRLVYRKTEDG